MEPQQTIRLLMSLRRQGISDQRVLAAMERVPRERFVPEALAEHAYDDTALPIEAEQTISQPYVVAYMTQRLDVTVRMKVLEVGTGSGYQTAVLALLCRRVYTIERHRALSRTAEARFAALGLTNVTTRVGDGMLGWPEQAPFDRIVVTAAVAGEPTVLLGQLKVGGILVYPREEDRLQHLVKVVLTENGPAEERLIAVRFVPIRPGVAPED